VDKGLPRFGKDHSQAQTIAVDSGDAVSVRNELPQILDKNRGAALLSFLIGLLESIFAKCQDVDLSAETMFWENSGSHSEGSG
jgi:hypothetical protein